MKLETNVFRPSVLDAYYSGEFELPPFFRENGIIPINEMIKQKTPDESGNRYEDFISELEYFCKCWGFHLSSYRLNRDPHQSIELECTFFDDGG